MNQKLIVRNTIDEKGQPCGGSVHGVGIFINWQDGPMDEQCRCNSMCAPSPFPMPDHELREKPGHNGAFVEGVIQAAIHRLRFYQGTKFACDENSRALENLHKAMFELNSRTQRRIAEGTEGTHQGN